MAEYLYDHFLARYELDVTAAERYLVQFLGSIDRALDEDADPAHQPLVRHDAHHMFEPLPLRAPPHSDFLGCRSRCSPV